MLDASGLSASQISVRMVSLHESSDDLTLASNYSQSAYSKHIPFRIFDVIPVSSFHLSRASVVALVSPETLHLEEIELGPR